MSLNVYLFITKPYCECCKREEEKSMVFHANITSNLWEVAENVGIYKCVWKPREIGIIKAGDLISPLSDGLEKLKSNPEYYKKFNSTNGWGLYENFVPWIERYLQACIDYPDA